MGEVDTSASVTCPHCGRQVISEVEFCPNCGGSLRAVNFCPRCGAVPEKGQRHCSSCGENLVSATTTAGQPITKRPLGLTIIAVLWVLGGLLNIYTGFSTIGVDLEMMAESYYGYGFSSSARAWLAGVVPTEIMIMAVVALVGILQFVAIYGFWNRKRWSYRLGIAVPLVGIVTNLSETLLMMTAPQGYLFVDFFGVGLGIFFAMIYISYLRQPNVKQWLRVDKSNQFQ